ncbi:hypothetical protein DEU56DRAFT_754485 [Suillus clintonianus]|uniref:uncharacterized protein n=1 Tax=Suillus clintonianus TaxID=1904413 RepID=UPI001B86654D|nr:uncharacterized protein DEU56DRAFT_754485 [Suillus clintonianus]KAG2143685.1 hypothetical protein DEU56DRAFT_754485 [Suillus clintonianus]
MALVNAGIVPASRAVGESDNVARKTARFTTCVGLADVALARGNYYAESDLISSSAHKDARQIEMQDVLPIFVSIASTCLSNLCEASINSKEQSAMLYNWTLIITHSCASTHQYLVTATSDQQRGHGQAFEPLNRTAHFDDAVGGARACVFVDFKNIDVIIQNVGIKIVAVLILKGDSTDQGVAGDMPYHPRQVPPLCARVGAKMRSGPPWVSDLDTEK